jgi:hypothetical protein
MQAKNWIAQKSPKGEMKTNRRTPKQTLHAWCHYCIQSRLDEDVRECGGDFVIATGKACPSYPYRMSDRRTPISIFRKFCLECMGGNKTFIKECSTTDCLLYLFRMGKNPARSGKGASRERMMEISRRRMALSR